MGKIGGALVKEIKQTTMKSLFHRRYNMVAGLGTGKGKKNKSGIQWAYGWDNESGKKIKPVYKLVGKSPSLDYWGK